MFEYFDTQLVSKSNATDTLGLASSEVTYNKLENVNNATLFMPGGQATAFLTFEYSSDRFSRLIRVNQTVSNQTVTGDLPIRFLLPSPFEFLFDEKDELLNAYFDNNADADEAVRNTTSTRTFEYNDSALPYHPTKVVTVSGQHHFEQSFFYVTSPDGRISQIRISNSIAPHDNVIYLIYDLIGNQVDKICVNSCGKWQEFYTYDLAGRLTKITRNTIEIYSFTYSNNPSRVTSAVIDRRIVGSFNFTY